MTESASPTATPASANGTSNGVAKTVTPTPGQPSGTAPPAGDAAAQREAQMRAREEAIAKREKVFRDEAKKAAADKSGLGAKLSRLGELEKWKSEKEREEQLANLNPPEFAKKRWGDNWHERLNLAAVNGVPPADLIAAEMSKMRDDFEAKFRERDEAAIKSTQEASQRAYQESRSAVRTDCDDFYGANVAEYPLLETYGPPEHVGAILASFVEQQFATTKKLLSAKEAADKLESIEAERLEKAAAHEKYRQRLQDKMKPASLAIAGGAQGVPGAPRHIAERRTLSNNLTASTPGRAPPVSDEERERRAIEAWNAAHNRKP